MKQSILILVALFPLTLAGCGQVQSLGGKVFDASDRAIEVVEAGRERVDSQAANIARNHLQRWEDQADFADQFGKDADQAILGAYDDRVQRMLAVALAVCQRSETRRITFDYTGGQQITISCQQDQEAASDE